VRGGGGGKIVLLGSPGNSFFSRRTLLHVFSIFICKTSVSFAVSKPPYLICTGRFFSGVNGAVIEDGHSPQSNIEVMDGCKEC